VLIDGDVPESVPMIAESIRKLGFKITDVKYIVNSHTHFDHAGGIAGLQKLSGATVMASTWSAEALKTGGGAKDDPQYSPARQFESVAKVQVIEDNAVLKLASIAMTAHYTPGHTPGGTTWTWQSCEGERCMNMVYADSLNAIGSNTYRFSDPVPRGYFGKSFAVFENLRCDILVSAHPEVSGLWDRLEKRQKGDVNGLVDRGACKAYAAGAKERWEQRLQTERSAGR
jgi:metallo-beta-lactamase class B